jgi:DNA-binding CsgD family transcriptional regulator
MNPLGIILDITAIGVYLCIVWQVFCQMPPRLGRRTAVITLLCVPVCYVLWVAAWYSGISPILTPARVSGWISVALISARRPGLPYREGLNWTLLSFICLAWMNHLFDAYLNTWLWVFPVFNWQDTNTFAIRYCALRLAIALFCLVWSFCFRRIIRGLGKPPQVKILVLLFISAAFSSRLLYAFTTRAVIPPRPDDEILLVVGTMGFILCAAFMFLFYFYINSLKKQEAQSFALVTADTPPVWNAADGVSEAFISRYKLSAKEAEVTNELLKGKTDKEIALAMDIAVNTVQVHLQKVYNKTGARGRFALQTLVRG